MNIYKAFGLRKKQANVTSAAPDDIRPKLTRGERRARDREEAKIAEAIQTQASKSPTIHEAYEMRDIDRWKQSMLKNPFRPDPKQKDKQPDKYADLRDLDA